MEHETWDIKSTHQNLKMDMLKEFLLCFTRFLKKWKTDHLFQIVLLHITYSQFLFKSKLTMIMSTTDKKFVTDT